MPIERPNENSCLLVIAMVAISVTILDIFAFKMCVTLTLAFRMGQSKLNMPIKIPYSTFYLLTVAMFALSVTISEIFAV